MSKRNEGDIEAILGSLVGPPPPALHPHAAEAAREQLRRDVRALQERPEQLLLHLHAPPPPPLQSARLPARSTPLLIVAAAAILIGILIAGGLYAPAEPTPATPTNNLVHQPDVPPEAPTDPPPPPASQSPLPSTPTRPPPPQVPAPIRRPQPAPHSPQSPPAGEAPIALSPPPTPDVQDGLVYADDLPQPTSAIRGSGSSITFDPDYLRLWIPPAGTTGCSVGTAVPPPAYPSGTRVRLCGNIRTAAPWELSTLLRVRNPTGELVFDKRLHIGQEALFLGEVTLDVPGTWELRIGVGEQARRLTLEVQP